MRKNRNSGWLLLVLMVVQNSSTVLVGRYTRAVPTQDRYVVNHMMIVTEFLKFLLSCALEHSNSNKSLVQSIQHHVIQRPREALKMAIPALLYLVQNSLVYVSLSYVSAPLFQVTYQSKLLTTALLSSILLKRKYTCKHWLCILALSAGVAIVVCFGEITDGPMNRRISSADVSELYGLGLVGIACLCSSLAGVYFEKVIKVPCQKKNPNDMTQQPPVSLWMRNVQFSFFSCSFAVLQHVAISDKKGFFHGFTLLVYLQILLLGGGGLVVAGVIKHTDCVQKGLETGVSVLVTTVVSNLFWRTGLTASFVAGVCLIVGGVYFFSNPGGKSLLFCIFAAYALVSSRLIFSWQNHFLEDTSYHLSHLVEHAAGGLSPSFYHYNTTIDVLSIGSQARSDYQEAQRRTWASHGSIRYFFGVDETIDADPDCVKRLKTQEVYLISDFCRSKELRAQFRGTELSFLEKHQADNFARREWLKEKPSPVGWMCGNPRPVLGLEAALSVYADHEMPDFLVVANDDAFFNMEVFHQYLRGCSARTHPQKENNASVSNGGFTLSKAELKNLIQPIRCDGESGEFDKAVCERLQEPLLDEAQLFEPGMRLIDLMMQLASFQPYTSFINWTTGFCQQDDWIFGYFFYFYNVTNSANSPGGHCSFGLSEECNSDAMVCHNQTPEMMHSINNRTCQKAPSYAFPPRKDFSLQLRPPKSRGLGRRVD